jgi:hypothetical protein
MCGLQSLFVPLIVADIAVSFVGHDAASIVTAVTRTM